MTAKPSKSRARRVLRWTLRIAGGALALVFTLVVIVLTVADLPWGRRLAAREVNGVLAPMFKGKIVIDRVGSLHLGGVGGVSAHIEAPDGTTVLVARGVGARIRPIALLESLLRRSGDLRVDVFDLDVRSIEVDVNTDDAGVLKIQSAFDPGRPPPPPSATPTRGLDLTFSHVTLGHVWIHGRMKSAPPIDADLDKIVAAIHVPPNAMTIDVSRAELLTRGMPQRADAKVSLEAHLAMPSPTGADLGARGAFRGDIGGIPTTASGTFDGDRIDAVVDVPEVAAARVRRLLPQVPLQRPASVHIEAHGPLAALRATLEAHVGASRVDANADATLTGKPRATARIDAKDVDLRGFSPTGPASALAFTSTIRVDTKSDGNLGGDFTLDVAPGEFASQVVPPASLHGTFDQTKRGFAGTVSGSIAERGAPTDLRVTFEDDGASPVVGFDVSTQIDRLAEVKRVPGLGGGRAALHARGTVTLGTTPAIDATAHVEALRLEQASVQVGAATIEGHAYGALSNPRLDATVSATSLRAAGYAYREAQLTAEGSLARENVSVALLDDRTGNVRLTTSVAVRGPGSIEIDDTKLDVSRGGKALHARIDRASAGGGRFDVVGAVIDGVGATTRATVHVRPASLVVESDSNGIDLETLGYVLGLDKTIRRGSVKYAVDLTARPDTAEGTAVFDLANACFGQIDGLTGHVDTRLEGRQVSGAVQLGADGIGRVNADPVRIDLAGTGPLEAASWRGASGDLRLSGDVDLARLIGLLPANTVPVAKISGKLTIDGQITRAAGADALPDVTFTAKTTGLQVATRRRPDEVKHGVVLVSQPAWDASGVDVQMAVDAHATRGTAKLSFALTDSHGTVLEASASSEAVPFRELVASRDGALDRLMQVPMTARMDMPSRHLDQLPDLFKVVAVRGAAEASMSFDGTGLAPRFDLRAKGHDLQLQGSKRAAPVEASLDARYDGSRAEVTMTVRDAERELLHAGAQLNAKVNDLVRGGGSAPWDASADAKLERFPLEAVPALSDRRMHGTLDGEFKLDNLHKDTRAKIGIDAEGLRVGKEKYGGGKVNVAFDGHSLDADLRLEQDGGFANANAKIPLHWGADLAPSPDPTGALEGSFKAKKFRIGFLAPFVQSVLDSLDGTVDADARVSMDPHKKPDIAGSVSFDNGTLGVAALGQELHGVKGRVVLAEDGNVRLEGVEARGTAGKVTASGSAHLEGTSLVSADLNAEIAKRDAMPVDAQGTDVGYVYGKFGVKMTTSADRRAMNVAVDVPSVHVQLSEASTHSAQDLGDLPAKNHIGVYTAPGRFTALPLDGHDAAPPTDAEARNTLTVGVKIDDAEVARGTDLRVHLGGNLVAKVEQKTEVTGQIQLHSGKLDVQGKSFEIENGTVTFTGDPSNPEIKVTAGWQAEDGTHVYADYVGPLKTGKVTLRSEPARPQNEILALVLFGTADGSESTPYASPDTTSTGAKAGTTVGAFATGGLSKGLDKLTGLDITTKIDTSQPNPRPEVEVQIARNISIELAVVLGTPPPGTNQDTTYITVDWRFHRSWSLETTFGNLGSSMADVVWRRRY